MPSSAVVLRVGTDILFSLACIHDFKQEMLATAVRDGLLEVKGTGILDDVSTHFVWST